MTRFAIDPPSFLQLASSDLRLDGHQLVAPAALRSQTAALLYRSVRSAAVDQAAVTPLLERITTIKVRLLGDRVSRRRAWQIATELGLEDMLSAEYVAVAQLQADLLVTADPQLRAIADGIVPVAGFEALEAAVSR